MNVIDLDIFEEPYQEDGENEEKDVDEEEQVVDLVLVLDPLRHVIRHQPILHSLTACEEMGYKRHLLKKIKLVTGAMCHRRNRHFLSKLFFLSNFPVHFASFFSVIGCAKSLGNNTQTLINVDTVKM